MAQDEQTQVAIREFAGQVSNKNPHNLAPGEMVVQVNCLSRRLGELTIRGGLREQQGDTES